MQQSGLQSWKYLLFDTLHKELVDLCCRSYEGSDPVWSCISAYMPGAMLSSDQFQNPTACLKKLNAFILISIAIVINLVCLVNFTQAQQR